MIYRNNGRWELAKFLVKYSDRGYAREDYVDSPLYLQAFANRWDHVVINEITEVEPTEEQIARFNKISGFPEDFKDVYAQYVLDGTFIESSMPANHPFKAIQMAVETEISTNVNTQLALELVATQMELAALQYDNMVANFTVSELMVEVMELKSIVADLIPQAN